MSERRFVDTNILVYAHDSTAGDRHEKARELVEQLWQDRTGVVSTQVLQELYVNVRHKVSQPLPASEARELVADYLRWDVVVNNGDSILEAIEIEQRFSLSFWDALIVQAAQQAGASVLYSEDLTHRGSYGTVEVINPFLPDG